MDRLEAGVNSMIGAPNPVPGSKLDHDILALALKHSDMSKDPNTRVGAVITTVDGTPVSTGFNQFPRGIAHTPERLACRTTKNRRMVHAEMGALLQALREGRSTMGCRLYIACTDDSGEIWGGAPCSSNCMKHVIEAGISEVRCYPAKLKSAWNDEIAESIADMNEVGMKLTLIQKPPGLVHVRTVWA
jgi:deoxycytidylate deaminase